MAFGRASKTIGANVALVALLVSATMSGGAIFFAVTEHAGHAHADLVGWRASLPTWVDGIGLVLMLLLSVQMMLGYRLFSVPGKRFRPLHVSLAWSIVAIMALHMAGGFYHTLTTGLEVLPVWINAAGLVAAALLAIQLGSGYGQPRGTRLRRVHVFVAVPILLVVATHGLLGVFHNFLG